MIIKNKTGMTQSVYLKDGRKVTARPYRTITLDEMVSDLDASVWEVEGETVKKQKQKGE